MQRRIKRYFIVLSLAVGLIVAIGIVNTSLQTENITSFTHVLKSYMKWAHSECLTTNKAKVDHLKKERETLLNATITHNLWMLWDKGWDKAPPLQAMCIKSFKRKNPDFTIHALNLSEAEKLINRKKYYPDNSWRKATIQSKADIIRVELLATHGGVWADATVYCNEPLSNWIFSIQIEDWPGGFFAYERKDKAVNEQNAPWISNWFMIATTNSRIIRTWRNTIREAWATDPIPQQSLGYFWPHRVFRNLTKTNAVFLQDFMNVPFMDAGGPHCFLNNTKPHVYKTKACSKLVVEELFRLEEQYRRLK